MGEIVAGRKRSPRLDMTPMVDLAFLLLTFFMLTTVFTEHYVMKIQMPENSNNSQPINEKQVVTLILGSNDKVYWYKGFEKSLSQTDFSSGGIRTTLQELNHSIRNMVVLIKPSTESRYQNLIDIFDEMTITGISRYYLVDITSEDINLVKSKLNQHE
jgi:biopolymer transport protein ExbD